MRSLSALLALFLALAIWPPAFSPVWAQETPQSAAASIAEAFATLKTTSDRQEAKRAEQRIIQLWLESGSDTIDLLMSWTLRAIDEEDFAGALDYLDRIILLKPDYAEGWNKRATVYFLTDDYAMAIADIEQVLKLEPRHFGAMSGLGAMLSEIGDDQRAIEAYEQALEVDPVLDKVREALGELREMQVGSEI